MRISANSNSSSSNLRDCINLNDALIVSSNDKS
jgi:hypothetical protein